MNRPIWQTRNWSGHHTFRAARVHTPTDIATVPALVRQAQQLKVIGSRHCFHDIADTEGDMLWLGQLSEPPHIDAARRQVTCHGGTTYESLCPVLQAAGWALPNLPSLKHVTVAGACMTSTHGSGDALGQLATALAAIELVLPSGDIRRLERDRDGDDFRAAAVSLGALGVVLRLTLDLVPAFWVQQDVYEHLPLDAACASFDAVFGTAYSVSGFTTWQEDRIDAVWVKRVVPGPQPVAVPEQLLGAHLVSGRPNASPPGDRTLTPFAEPGVWHERLPHYAFHDALAMGDELQSEYFVPRHHAAVALRAVAGLRAGLKDILGLSEVRTLRGDDLWLSCTQGQDSVGIHFNWLNRSAEVQAFLPTLEATLAPFGARPHLGKLFALSTAQLAVVYPRWPDFAALRKRWDPEGRLANQWVRRHLHGEAAI